MKTGIVIPGTLTGRVQPFEEVADFMVEAERLGIDSIWSAEAWGEDAVTPLAYLAARTKRVLLGSGIMQISARSPVMTAMTAMSLARLSNDRFILGLGVSGPQVVEGLHGQPFARPLRRLRETIEIIRMACSGEKIRYRGEVFELPRPGGEGKALKLTASHPHIPIYVAALGEKSLELTGELADGWVGTSFTPEGADFYTSAMRRGAGRAGRSLADITLCVGGAVQFTDDVEQAIAAKKGAIAFQVSAMGTPTKNFYHNAYRHIGYADAVQEIRDLWLAGKREEATRRVPDEMVTRTALIGTDDMVRARIRAYRDAGVGILMLLPDGRTDRDRLDTLGRALDLVRQVNAEGR
ncbi:MAG: LLM class flavin-dependent oxidoreductase [Gammaproteobacteria bacterium]